MTYSTHKFFSLIILDLSNSRFVLHLDGKKQRTEMACRQNFASFYERSPVFFNVFQLSLETQVEMA